MVNLITFEPPAAADTAPSCALSLLDPAGLGPLPRVPLIPEATRRRHRVLVPADHRFKAAARFLQALWREDRDLPIGHHSDGKHQPFPLGSRIGATAGRRGANFLHPDIAAVAARALAYREPGAAYDVERLRTNLLSSQPLAFNLFGLLARDLTLATRFMAEFMPGLLREVTTIAFEHSPGRGDPRFTADGTAFDVVVRGRTDTGERLFVAIEVKYSESGAEPVPRISPRYGQIAPATNLFVAPDGAALVTNPCQQLFRQHCLAATMLSAGLADRAVLAFVAPAHNQLATAAALTYSRHLHNAEAGPIPFVYPTLEHAIACIAGAGLPEHARALHRRYTDWWLVDGELQLDISPKPAKQPQAPKPFVAAPAHPTTAAPSPRKRRSARTRQAA